MEYFSKYFQSWLVYVKKKIHSSPSSSGVILPFGPRIYQSAREKKLKIGKQYYRQWVTLIKTKIKTHSWKEVKWSEKPLWNPHSETAEAIYSFARYALAGFLSLGAERGKLAGNRQTERILYQAVNDNVCICLPCWGHEIISVLWWKPIRDVISTVKTWAGIYQLWHGFKIFRK